MQLTPRYTSDQLIEAVANSNNIRQVCLALGLRGRGGNYETIRRHIKRLAIDTSHFGKRSREVAVQRRWFDEPVKVGRRQITATTEDLEVAVAQSRSLAEVARRIGLKVDPHAYRTLNEAIEKCRLDTSHLKGQGWNRDENVTCRPPRPLEEILVKHGRPYNSSRIRRRLTQEGLKEDRCEGCEAESWLGHPIPLELDHLNGDRRDNRIENLRLLCPNCHALTDNYRGRNIGR